MIQCFVCREWEFGGGCWFFGFVAVENATYVMAAAREGDVAAREDMGAQLEVSQEDTAAAREETVVMRGDMKVQLAALQEETAAARERIVSLQGKIWTPKHERGQPKRTNW